MAQSLALDTYFASFATVERAPVVFPCACDHTSCPCIVRRYLEQLVTISTPSAFLIPSFTSPPLAFFNLPLRASLPLLLIDSCSEAFATAVQAKFAEAVGP